MTNSNGLIESITYFNSLKSSFDAKRDCKSSTCAIIQLYFYDKKKDEFCLNDESFRLYLFASFKEKVKEKIKKNTLYVLKTTKINKTYPRLAALEIAEKRILKKCNICKK